MTREREIFDLFSEPVAGKGACAEFAL
jgi:hypothetical protein